MGDVFACAAAVCLLVCSRKLPDPWFGVKGMAGSPNKKGASCWTGSGRGPINSELQLSKMGAELSVKALLSSGALELLGEAGMGANVEELRGV